MSGFKHILVPVSDSETGQSPLEAAFIVGRRFSSHVVALHVRSDPTSAVPLVGEGMSGAMVEEMMTVAEQQAAERAARAKAMFEQSCSRHDVPRASAPPVEGLSAAWNDETGREEDLVARHGRLTDLLVVGRPQPDRDIPSALTLNAALMESGRPLLMAPAVVPATIGENVVIAWNGSAEAGRAVAAAMPFLHKASRICILSARENGADPATSPGELAAYLAWHGLDASCHVFTEGANTGETLLREVAALGGDLLVMGAYTHSRLRQLILGGVTRHMLGHATIPVLMSH